MSLDQRQHFGGAEAWVARGGKKKAQRSLDVGREFGATVSDAGRVIGRQGQTVLALRTLFEALARARGETCRVEVLE